MPLDSDSLDAALDLMRQLETLLLGLRQVRTYVGNGVGLRMLDEVIKDAETKLAEIRSKLIQ